MQRTLTRVLLLLLGVLEGVPGLWPLITPIGFYQDFPGFRAGWVSMDGPFNEHLIRDFGGLNLALAATLIGAAVIGTTAVARLASVATLLFAVPHLVYHLGHLSHFGQLDRVLIIATLSASLVLPVVTLLLPGRRVSSPATP